MRNKNFSKRKQAFGLPFKKPFSYQQIYEFVGIVSLAKIYGAIFVLPLYQFPSLLKVKFGGALLLSISKTIVTEGEEKNSPSMQRKNLSISEFWTSWSDLKKQKLLIEENKTHHYK